MVFTPEAAIAQTQSNVTASKPTTTVVTDSFSLRVFFHQGYSILEPSYRENEENLNAFVSKIRKTLSDPCCRISDITISSGASPEGNALANKKLSENRAQSLYKYLKYSLSLPDSIFRFYAVGEDWQGLRQLVLKYNIPYDKEIVNIIDNTPLAIYKDGVMVDSRKKRLMELHGGTVWTYMLEHIFPELRSSSNSVICHFTKQEPGASHAYVTASHVDTLYIYNKRPTDTIYVYNQPGYANQPANVSQPVKKAKTRHPWFALGTNLIFDLAAGINVEVEVPIKNKYSIVVEHTFPWWLFNFSGKHYTSELLRTGVEARYWLGNRAQAPLLTGFFVGVYANADYFDIEWNNRGWQGETFTDFGASVGWSKKIHKNWRLELNLGVGYFHTKYTEYIHRNDLGVLLYNKEDNFTWIGPTKLKCTLSWLLPNYPRTSKGSANAKKKKKGGKR